MPGGPGNGRREGGVTMTPSKRDFLRYDAQRYEKDGFTEVSGRVRELAQKPRFWQVTATARTRDPETGEVVKHHFNIKARGRYMLSELAPVINDEIHSHDDYLPDCISVMVVARVMM